MATATLDPRQRARTRTALAAIGVVLGMLALAYASVPLYRIFCQVTGFGGTTQYADRVGLPSAEARAAAAGHMIRVRFDANTRRDLPWAFRPTETSVEIPIGEQRLTHYRAANESTQRTTGMATYNVSPSAAGRYFVKMQCFCFNEQTLAPGQAVDMPVVYFVDPAILDDPDASRIREITLSYSFFPVDEPSSASGIRATGAGELARRR